MVSISTSVLLCRLRDYEKVMVAVNRSHARDAVSLILVAGILNHSALTLAAILVIELKLSVWLAPSLYQ